MNESGKGDTVDDRVDARTFAGSVQVVFRSKWGEGFERSGDWIERRGGGSVRETKKRDAGLGSNKYECIKAGKPRSIIMQYAMHMQHVQA